MNNKKTITTLLLIILATTLTAAYDYCESGNQGSRLEISSITDKLKDNTKEFKWDENQNIELKVKVKNNLEYIEDFKVEIVFLDDKNSRVSIVEDDEDLEYEFTLENSEVKELEFNFELEEDISLGNYYMYVKYYVEGEESKFCKQVKKDITIGTLNKCSSNSGNIEILGFKDNKEDNFNSWEWRYNDDVSLDFYIKNKAATQDFDMSLSFFNDKGDIIELANEDDLSIKGTLANGEEEDVTFSFNVNNVPIGYYGVYINILSEEDNEFCYNKKITGAGDDTFIMIEDDDKIEVQVFGDINVTKNTQETYKVSVKNKGSRVQEKISVSIYSQNINYETIFIENLAGGASEEVSFKVNIPNKTSDEVVVFRVEYDFYDDDYESYAIQKKTLKINEDKEETKEEVIDSSKEESINVSEPVINQQKITESEEIEPEEKKSSFSIVKFIIYAVLFIVAVLVALFIWFLISPEGDY